MGVIASDAETLSVTAEGRWLGVFEATSVIASDAETLSVTAEDGGATSP